MITAKDFTKSFLANKKDYRKEASTIIDKALSLLLEHPITSYQLHFSFDEEISDALADAIEEELEERGFSLVTIHYNIAWSAVGVSFEFPTEDELKEIK